MARLTVDDVTKVYDDGTEAVKRLSLDIGDAELVVFVGPSGCGKTTALRMIAGLEEITSGTISVGDRVINDVDPRKRDLAMVFQNYALYPHMTVAENIGFPLRLAGLSKKERAERVRVVARTLGLESHLHRKPRHLSGGQRQRVAMGRAIIRQPQAFLMDEPLSNLDAKLRVQMRAEISSLQKELGVTTVYVTHDQVEAMTMGDRVAVMRRGELQQFGPPEQVYESPSNLFVAGFIGSPPMNLLEGDLVHTGDGFTLDIGGCRVRVEAEEAARAPRLAQFAGRPLVVGIRPERLEDRALEPGIPADRVIRGVVRIREALGSEVLVHLVVEGARTRLGPALREFTHDVEDPVELEEPESLPGADIIGRFSPQSRTRQGDAVEAALRPGALQFFDPATGQAIA
jgi:multiple sugar transport system ATP-binding protein